MPFIPHTPTDIDEMLATLGVSSLDDLFSEIPATLPRAKLEQIPEGENEMSVTRALQERADQHFPGSCFIGAGAYEHHIPAIVGEVMRRGEFYTAYTPYQAEASQGSLQLVFEYQTMMANLMALPVSNASLYDGATAVVESVMMAIRAKRGRAKRILVPRVLHPHYRQVLHTVVERQGIVLEELPYDQATGTMDPATVSEAIGDDCAALIIAQPNFFGSLENIDALTDAAHAAGALVVAVVNPMAMSLLKPPGQWGADGADIACGEGQPLGVPLSGGGPYFGFVCTKKQFVRQLPGRIVGETIDAKNRRGYTLTLQAREQHIRRAKATSNICTNQGLMVVAATVYMSLMGAVGLREVACASHTGAVQLRDRLIEIDGITSVFSSSFFHEFVIQFDRPVKDIVTQLAQHQLQPGLALQSYYPELGESLLVCVTETKNQQDLQRYQQLLARSMNA